MSRSNPLLILATQNPHKLSELRELFADLALARIVSAAELGAPEVIEDGATLEHNARKKARELAAFAGKQEPGAAASGWLALADDTGLAVDALNGAPGVYSARYAGENASYADNCQKLLAALGPLPRERRTARFRTVMALVGQLADGRPIERQVEGAVEGWIASAARGNSGFGYDPVFVLEDPLADRALCGRTLAELSPMQKNGISHRARAAAAMRRVLDELLVGA